MTTNETPGPSGTIPDQYLEDISADELSTNAPADETPANRDADGNATESGANDADVSATPSPFATSLKHSTKSGAGYTLPQSNASCLSPR
jgi:hypothetical protein